ncbi:cell division protein CdvA [Saccharolobus shibatae]|nr:cell division protein CdvA [Saccharolobus shibatae]
MTSLRYLKSPNLYKYYLKDQIFLRSITMPVSYEALTKFIGQKVKDIYGREFGYLIHVYSEIDGSITGIEVAQGSSILTIGPERIKLDGDSILILPDWKAEAIRILSLMEKIRKRQRALEELYNKQEIPKSDYDDMKRKLDTEMLKLKDDQNKLKGKLKSRLNDIEDQLAHIDKAVISLKMSYISSEIPENAYKGSMEVLRQSKDSYTLERDDIRKTLDRLDSLDKESIELKPLGSLSTSQQGEAKSDQSKSEIPLPIPVKVINTL